MRQKILFLLPLAVLVLFVSALAVAVTDTVIVNVTVGSVSQITVVPEMINWSGMTPGTAGGIINLTLKNTGSVNLSSIFAYINTNETESIRPYGIDNPLNYSSGGMLVMKNSTAPKYFWGQRKEWNWTTDIMNVIYPATINDASKAARGFFRNASVDYVWVLGNGTDGYCNNTGTIFAISDRQDDGSITTRSPDDSNIVFTEGIDYGYFAINRVTAPLSTMCVAVSKDCTYILIYKYDKRAGFNTCGNSAYIRSNALTPGSTDFIYTDAWVPKGIPAGQLNLATLTVEAA